MKKQQYARIEEGFFNFVTTPKGVIVIWSGAANAIPAGWALCDGTNGTPDLRGRFIVGGIAGSGFNSIGNKGGMAEITLQPFNLPEHTHSGTTAENGRHNHRTYATDDGGRNDETTAQGGNNYQQGGFYTEYSGIHNHTFTTNTGDQPTKSTPINILPPYYALAYIMKL